MNNNSYLANSQYNNNYSSMPNLHNASSNL